MAEREKRFKLLDLGGACDLFTRRNYDSQLQVFDPKFGPPEAPPAEGGLVPSAGGNSDKSRGPCSRTCLACLWPARALCTGWAVSAELKCSERPQSAVL